MRTNINVSNMNGNISSSRLVGHLNGSANANVSMQNSGIYIVNITQSGKNVIITMNTGKTYQFAMQESITNITTTTDAQGNTIVTIYETFGESYSFTIPKPEISEEDIEKIEEDIFDDLEDKIDEKVEEETTRAEGAESTLSSNITTVSNNLTSYQQTTNSKLTEIEGKLIDTNTVAGIVTSAISDLDYSDSAVNKKFVTSVSEESGIISVTREELSADDIPNLTLSKISDAGTAASRDVAAPGDETDTTKLVPLSILNTAFGVLQNSINSTAGMIVTNYKYDDNVISTGLNNKIDTTAQAIYKKIGEVEATIIDEDTINDMIDAKVPEPYDDSAILALHADKTGGGKETVAEEIEAAIDDLDLPNTYEPKGGYDSRISALETGKANLDSPAFTTSITLDGEKVALERDIPDVSNFATKDELPDMSTVAHMADIPDVSGFATKEEIPDITGLATKEEIPDVSGFATSANPTFTGTATLNGNNIATTNLIPDISNLATKDEIPDISGLAEKSEIPDITPLATKANPVFTGTATLNGNNIATENQVIVTHTGSGVPVGTIIAKVNDIYRDTTTNKLYQCTAYNSEDSLTDLTNLTITWKDSLARHEAKRFYINYTVQGTTQTFDVFRFGSQGVWYNVIYGTSETNYLARTTSSVANYEVVNEQFKTITITGGTDATNEDLISYIKANTVNISGIGSQWVEVSPSPDLSSYALKTEIPDISNLADKSLSNLTDAGTEVINALIAAQLEVVENGSY